MSEPTKTALAAKALLERIDNPTHLGVLENRAVLGGWVGSRQADCWDTKISDAIAKAAWDAVLGLLRTWAAECDEPYTHPEQEGPEKGNR